MSYGFWAAILTTFGNPGATKNSDPFVAYHSTFRRMFNIGGGGIIWIIWPESQFRGAQPSTQNLRP